MSTSSKALRDLLNERKKTRGFIIELSQKSGIKPPQLQRYLTGKNVPSLDVLDRIADAMEADPWELIKPQDAVERPPPTIEALLEKIEEQKLHIRELESKLEKFKGFPELEQVKDPEAADYIRGLISKYLRARRDASSSKPLSKPHKKLD